MVKSKYLKSKNNTNNYNAIRQREIQGILNEDSNIMRRAFALEKDEYIKQYPDVGSQVDLKTLNPQEYNNFSNICSRFVSILIFFTSALNDLDTTRGLKWNELFDSFNVFKNYIESFMKRNGALYAPQVYAQFENASSRFVTFYERLLEQYDYYLDDRHIPYKPIQKSYIDTIQQQWIPFFIQRDSQMQRFALNVTPVADPTDDDTTDADPFDVSTITTHSSSRGIGEYPGPYDSDDDDDDDDDDPYDGSTVTTRSSSSRGRGEYPGWASVNSGRMGRVAAAVAARPEGRADFTGDITGLSYGSVPSYNVASPFARINPIYTGESTQTFANIPYPLTTPMNRMAINAKEAIASSGGFDLNDFEPATFFETPFEKSSPEESQYVTPGETVKRTRDKRAAHQRDEDDQSRWMVSSVKSKPSTISEGNEDDVSTIDENGPWKISPAKRLSTQEKYDVKGYKESADEKLQRVEEDEEEHDSQNEFEKAYMKIKRNYPNAKLSKKDFIKYVKYFQTTTGTENPEMTPLREKYKAILGQDDFDSFEWELLDYEGSIDDDDMSPPRRIEHKEAATPRSHNQLERSKRLIRALLGANEEDAQANIDSVMKLMEGTTPENRPAEIQKLHDYFRTRDDIIDPDNVDQLIQAFVDIYNLQDDGEDFLAHDWNEPMPETEADPTEKYSKLLHDLGIVFDADPTDDENISKFQELVQFLRDEGEEQLFQAILENFLSKGIPRDIAVKNATMGKNLLVALDNAIRDINSEETKSHTSKKSKSTTSSKKSMLLAPEPKGPPSVSSKKSSASSKKSEKAAVAPEPEPQRKSARITKKEAKAKAEAPKPKTKSPVASKRDIENKKTFDDLKYLKNYVKSSNYGGVKTKLAGLERDYGKAGRAKVFNALSAEEKKKLAERNIFE